MGKWEVGDFIVPTLGRERVQLFLLSLQLSMSAFRTE